MCSSGYKAWPILAMGYTVAIRAVELVKIDSLLKDRRLKYLFLGVFFPTFGLLLGLGVSWWIEAIKSDCNANDSFAYFGVIFISILRFVLFFVLIVFLIKDRVRVVIAYSL